MVAADDLEDLRAVPFELDGPEPGDGQFLVRHVYLSLDPYQRSAMAGRHMTGRQPLGAGDMPAAPDQADAWLVTGSRHGVYDGLPWIEPLKAFLRAARPRTFDQVVELVAIALPLFSPPECLNFVRHCGYCVSTPL